MKVIWLAPLTMVVAALGLSTFLLMPAEQFRLQDPSGKYTAIVSSRRFLSYIPMMPGQGSDKPGFLTIVDDNDAALGRIPVDMIQMARDIKWTPTGTKITLIGEWNFEKGTYSYWNIDQRKRSERA